MTQKKHPGKPGWREHKRKEKYVFTGEEGRPEKGATQRIPEKALIKGQEFDVEIEDIGHKGDGIVQLEGYTVFVPNTEKGEKVRIKIKRVRETVAFADRIT